MPEGENNCDSGGICESYSFRRPEIFYSFAPLGIVATKQIGESPPLDNHCSDSYVLTGNRLFNLQ